VEKASVSDDVLPMTLVLRHGFFRTHFGQLARIGQISEDFDELSMHIVFSDASPHALDVLLVEEYPDWLYEMESTVYEPTVAEYEVALGRPGELVIGASLIPPMRVRYRLVDSIIFDSDEYDAGLERIVYERVRG